VEEFDRLLPDLRYLTSYLPEGLLYFVCLDTQSISQAVDYFYRVNQERLGMFFPILQGSYAEAYPYALPSLGWNHGSSSLGFCAMLPHTLPAPRPVTQALCLPTDQEKLSAIQEAINSFGETPFRVIPEHLLTHAWEGVDTLFTFSCLHPESVRRAIRGFIAAGGEVIYLPT
jgi:hypothetical protein